MTKKLFIAIAKIIAQVEDTKTQHMLFEAFADLFAQNNSRFARSTFKTACRLSE